MTAVDPSLDLLTVNTIRALSIDMIERANSGHPGLPLGAAPMAWILWSRHLRHDPLDPSWPDRDRFVLSAGHGSALLYALLHVSGYDVDRDDLMAFRQWGSKTAGHPEFGHCPGVEATTGPLGQGSANAVGMAMAERALARRFGEITAHWTYALVSDGDLMEGISAEAASLAGHLGLARLIYLYDCNGVSLDGPTSLTFSREDVAARYASYGWQVLTVEDGDTDLVAIDRALAEARADETRPSLVIVKTTIGYGSPAKAGTAAAHGAPLGTDEARATKAALGIRAGEFEVPDEVRAHASAALERGRAEARAWRERLQRWSAAEPERAAEWRRVWAGELPDGFDRDLPAWDEGESVATRAAAGLALNALAARVPELVGGDADLSCSTKTALSGESSFDAATGAGRNLHFGVREHAMGAIQNGILYHGGLRAYTSTFFVFSDYMRPAVRLAALARLPAIYVWTHDSVAVGEDGPTHQPIEHLASLRALPGLRVVRPADANEAAVAWRDALAHRQGPTALVLSRQGLTVLAGTRERAGELLRRGAYVLRDPEGPLQAILIASGSEVAVALSAAERAAARGLAVRVVSMPCQEDFLEEEPAWRDEVLPPEVGARVAVEAGSSFGWERWVGPAGRVVAIDRFGASAPGAENLARFGFSAEHVLSELERALEG